MQNVESCMDKGVIWWRKFEASVSTKLYELHDHVNVRIDRSGVWFIHLSAWSSLAYTIPSGTVLCLSCEQHRTRPVMLTTSSVNAHMLPQASVLASVTFWMSNWVIKCNTPCKGREIFFLP